MSGEIKLTSRNALRVLRPGPFRRYIIGSAISDTGTWMQVMTQGWVMATLTSSAFMLGLANFCAGVPMLALMMVGGSAANKFKRRSRSIVRCFTARVWSDPRSEAFWFQHGDWPPLFLPTRFHLSR